MRLPSTLLAAFTLLALPGCIVGEIRDSLKTANDQLVCVQFAMDEANHGLAQANDLLEKTNHRLDSVEQGLTRLDRTNTLIDNVEQGLGRIDSTNNRLGDLERQLALLESIENSLARLDQHLAGLRKSVSALDGVIPFLDLGGDYVEPTVPPPDEIPFSQLPEKQQAESGDPGSPADQKIPPAAEPASASGEPGALSPTAATRAARRDSLMGVWVSAYPDRSIAMIIHADGTYERSIKPPPASTPSPSAATAKSLPPGRSIEKGTWKRTGETVAFTPTSTPTPTATPTSPPPSSPASATATSPPAQPAPSAWNVKIVSISSKALALEVDSELLLFARP